MGLDFAAVVDSAPDAAIVVRTDSGEIVFANAQFEKLFGYRREQVIGQPVETLIPDRYKTVHVAHRRGYARSPVSRSMGTGLQLAARRQDGSEFPVEISLSSLTTEDGMVTTAFIRDITERRRADVVASGLTTEVRGLRDDLRGLRPTSARVVLLLLFAVMLLHTALTVLLR